VSGGKCGLTRSSRRDGRAVSVSSLVSGGAGVSTAGSASLCKRRDRDQVRVQGLVLPHDGGVTEPPVGFRTTKDTVERRQPLDRGCHLAGVVTDESGTAISDPLGYSAATESDDRRAAQERLRQHHGKRLLPLDREQQRRRLAQEGVFLYVVDGSDIPHQ